MNTPAATVNQVLRQRSRRRQHERSRFHGRLGLAAAGLVSLLAALTALWLVGAILNLLRDLPSIETLPARFEAPTGLLFQPTRLYDRSGQQVILALENPDAAGRLYLPIAPAPSGPALPAALITATLAASDPGFWFHPGFTLAGLSAGQHPTLAQRLVDEHLLADEPPGLRRALRERILAGLVTWRFGRAKIIEWYLNSADYGRLAYGADAAARVYLDKPAASLTLGEAALLAATAEAPALNPIDAPQAALERQKRLIQGMLRYRVISPAAGIAAAREHPALRQSPAAGRLLGPQDLQPQIAPTFARLALQQLETRLTRQQIERGRLRVLTTLDRDLQTQAVCAAGALLNGRLPPGCPPAVAQLAADGQPLLPEGAGQAELVVLDPATGQVLALSGPDQPAPENGPLPAHPAGTLVTPFIGLSAFARGQSPASLVWDIPSETDSGPAPNLDGRYHGPLRLRLALANDYIIPAAHLLQQVGLENALLTAQQFGLAYPQPTTPAPGSATEPAAMDSTQARSIWQLLRPLNLLEVSHAFAALANRGILAGRALAVEAEDGRLPRPASLHPVAIQRVDQVDGQPLLDWSATQTRPIAQPGLAYLMTDVLSDEPARWPSLGQPNPLEINRPAAVKPGYTPDGQDTWVVGYTPQHVAGVWLGAPPTADPQEIRRRIFAAGSLWGAILQAASRDQAALPFEIPSGVSELPVCDPSGQLPGPDCPNVVKEVFLAGSEPDQPDSLYRNIPVNRQTGRLATIFTPPELVELRPYLMTPPEAHTWELQAGLEPPPSEYDTIPVQSGPGSTSAQIISPAMFAPVRGKVPVMGTAGGEGFASYRIQVGPGFSPQGWYLVGQDSDQPVEQGLLGEWDTTGLNGLYAIQLVVSYQDKSARRATAMVTIDNQPPQIRILTPGRLAEITPAAGGRTVLQAEILDDLGLKEVTFTIDGKPLATLLQPPYAISWQAPPGKHTLVVQATDLAGNTSEASVEFTVLAAPKN